MAGHCWKAEWSERDLPLRSTPRGPETGHSRRVKGPQATPGPPGEPGRALAQCGHPGWGGGCRKALPGAGWRLPGPSRARAGSQAPLSPYSAQRLHKGALIPCSRSKSRAGAPVSAQMCSRNGQVSCRHGWGTPRPGHRNPKGWRWVSYIIPQLISAPAWPIARGPAILPILEGSGRFWKVPKPSLWDMPRSNTPDTGVEPRAPAAGRSHPSGAPDADPSAHSGEGPGAAPDAVFVFTGATKLTDKSESQTLVQSFLCWGNPLCHPL